MQGINSQFSPGKENLPSVVFIHGDLQNQTVFNNLNDKFQSLGHSTLLFDLPGHGLSQTQERPTQEIVKSLIEEHNLEKPIIVGHSAGGILGPDYLAKTGNASALVILNSTIINPKIAVPDLDWDEMYNQFMILSKEKFRKQEPLNYHTLQHLGEQETKLKGLQLTNPSGFQATMDFYVNLEEDPGLYEARIPILVSTSKEDKLISKNQLEPTVKKMKNARLIETSGDHNPLIKNPEELMKIIEDNYAFLLGQEA